MDCQAALCFCCCERCCLQLLLSSDSLNSHLSNAAVQGLAEAISGMEAVSHGDYAHILQLLADAVWSFEHGAETGFNAEVGGNGLSEHIQVVRQCATS